MVIAACRASSAARCCSAITERDRTISANMRKCSFSMRMTKQAAMAIGAASPSVKSAPRARNATISGAVAATTIRLASLASILRQIAQTAATTQTATSARANSATPSRHVEIAVVSANANVNVGPRTLAARILRRTRSSASTSTVARAEPRNKSKEGHGDERPRQEDPVKERAGWRCRAEERQSRNNDDPMDIGAEPRQRAILLAQERRIEGRLGGLEPRRSAASNDPVGRHAALSHSPHPAADAAPGGSSSGRGSLGCVDSWDSLLGANQIQGCFWEAVLGVMDRLVLSDAAWERMAPLIIG